MNCVFLMDPLDTVDVLKDTSYALMVGARRRGHEVFHVGAAGLSLAGDQVVFDATPATPTPRQAEPFEVGRSQRLSQDQVDVVFIRTDPPFDARYLMHTWLLDRLGEHAVVINAPHGLRTVNEKVWATRFTELVPPTLVTSSREALVAFLQEHGKVVAKPTDACGGAGVFVIRRGDTNAPVIFEMLSEDHRKPILVQKYVAEAEVGDKRILLLDGEPLGAVLRVHSDHDHRNNFFAGGKPQATELTARDKQIIQVLRPHLQQLGLHFVGIDVIGDYLIEVNVTSPTGMQEMNRLYDEQLEDQVIAHAERLAAPQKERTGV